MNPTNSSINPQTSGVKFENMQATKTDSGATQYSGQVTLGSRTIDVTVLVSEEKLAALGDKLSSVVEKTALKTAQAFVLADVSHTDVEKVTLKGEKLSIYQKGMENHKVTDLKQLAEGANQQTNLNKETAELVNYCVKDIFNFPHVQAPPVKVEKKEVKKEEEVAEEEVPDEVTDEDDLASVISENPEYLDDLEGLLNDGLEGTASKQLLEAEFELEKEEQPPVAQERRAPPPRPPRPDLNAPVSTEEAPKPEVKAKPEKPEPPSRATRPPLPSKKKEPPPVPPRDELPVELVNSSETTKIHEAESAEKKEDVEVKDNPAGEAPAEPEEELEAVASERAPAPPPPPPPPSPSSSSATNIPSPPPPPKNAAPRPQSAEEALAPAPDRGAHLSEIQKGIKLKKVEVEAGTDKKKPDESQLTESEKMSISMQKAIEARRAALNPDGEEEETDGASDDNWDDKNP